jgi:hypothetical protein
MHTCHARIQNGHILARQVVAIVIAAILLSQPLIASDSWSRIEKLKTRTWVLVQLSGGKYLEGVFLGADASGMTVRPTNQEEALSFKRDLIEMVAVNYSGRPWYSIPLSIVAAAGGGLAGAGIASLTTCSDNLEDCRKGRGALIVIPATGAAAVTYYLTRDRSGKKVIYSKQ